MGREITIAWVGRHQKDGWEALCTEYRSRIRHFLPIRDVVVRSKGSPDDPRRVEVEGQNLLDALPKPVWTVALDRTGKQRSSEELSRWLGARIDSWPHPIAFVIGSDLGLSRPVIEASDDHLSFGRITLPHTLARLVLYEQLYRMLSIRAGINYHRQSL